MTGTAIKAASSATNSLMLVDDVGNYINTTKTALSSTNTLSSTASDVISGAIGGLSTSGDIEGAFISASSALFFSKYTNLNTSFSGSASNLLGQTLGLGVKEYQINQLDFDITNIDFGEIDLAQAGVSGVASGASSVFKVSSGTSLLTQPTLGRTVSGDIGAGLFIGTAELSTSNYTVNDVLGLINDNVEEEGE